MIVSHMSHPISITSLTASITFVSQDLWLLNSFEKSWMIKNTRHFLRSDPWDFQHGRSENYFQPGDRLFSYLNIVHTLYMLSQCIFQCKLIARMKWFPLEYQPYFLFALKLCQSTECWPSFYVDSSFEQVGALSTPNKLVTTVQTIQWPAWGVFP